MDLTEFEAERALADGQDKLQRHLFDEAAAVLRAALELKQRALGDDHPDVALVRELLADASYADMKYDAAAKIYRELLKADALSQAEAEHKTKLQYKLCRALDKQREIDTAMQAYELCMVMCAGNLPEGHALRVLAADSYARFLRHSVRQVELAKVMETRAAEYRQQCLGEVDVAGLEMFEKSTPKTAPSPGLKTKSIEAGIVTSGRKEFAASRNLILSLIVLLIAGVWIFRLVSSVRGGSNANLVHNASSLAGSKYHYITAPYKVTFGNSSMIVNDGGDLNRTASWVKADSLPFLLHILLTGGAGDQWTTQNGDYLVDPEGNYLLQADSADWPLFTELEQVADKISQKEQPDKVTFVNASTHQDDKVMLESYPPRIFFVDTAQHLLRASDGRGYVLPLAVALPAYDDSKDKHSGTDLERPEKNPKNNPEFEAAFIKTKRDYPDVDYKAFMKERQKYIQAEQAAIEDGGHIGTSTDNITANKVTHSPGSVYYDEGSKTLSGYDSEGKLLPYGIAITDSGTVWLTRPTRTVYAGKTVEPFEPFAPYTFDEEGQPVKPPVITGQNAVVVSDWSAEQQASVAGKARFGQILAILTLISLVLFFVQSVRTASLLNPLLFSSVFFALLTGGCLTPDPKSTTFNLLAALMVPLCLFLIFRKKIFPDKHEGVSKPSP